MYCVGMVRTMYGLKTYPASKQTLGKCITHPLSRVVLSQSHLADRDSTAHGSGWVMHSSCRLSDYVRQSLVVSFSNRPS
jgi:hypothetical protein